jgi:hypothetical protein
MFQFSIVDNFRHLTCAMFNYMLHFNCAIRRAQLTNPLHMTIKKDIKLGIYSATGTINQKTKEGKIIKKPFYANAYTVAGCIYKATLLAGYKKQ